MTLEEKLLEEKAKVVAIIQRIKILGDMPTVIRRRKNLEVEYQTIKNTGAQLNQKIKDLERAIVMSKKEQEKIDDGSWSAPSEMELNPNAPADFSKYLAIGGGVIGVSLLVFIAYKLIK